METYTTTKPLQLVFKYSFFGFLLGAVSVGLTFMIVHSVYASPNALEVARQTVSNNWNKLEEIKKHCDYISQVADEVKKENEAAAKVIDLGK